MLRQIQKIFDIWIVVAVIIWQEIKIALSIELNEGINSQVKFGDGKIDKVEGKGVIALHNGRQD